MVYVICCAIYVMLYAIYAMLYANSYAICYIVCVASLKQPKITEAKSTSYIYIYIYVLYPSNI